MIQDQPVGYRVYFARVKAHEVVNLIRPKPKIIKIQNDHNGFFAKLEADILKQGIRNPICTWNIKVIDTKPQFVFRFGGPIHRMPLHFDTGLAPGDAAIACRTHGGSRLMVAQKHNLEIPILISSYEELPYEECKNQIDVLHKFMDSPKRVVFGVQNGLEIHALPQCHLTP